MGHPISVSRISKPVASDPESGRRILTPQLATRLHDHLARTIAQAVIQALDQPVETSYICEIIADFEDVYATRPIAENAGGSRYNDSLWLYILTRLYDPGLIVESGTHKGHTSWLFAQAAPEAQVRTYDVSHAELSHKDPSVHYIEADWMTDTVSASASERSLVFFDDHINHAQRLMEAANRGFSMVILDDNFSASTLYATGAPPVPTLDMIMHDDLPDGFEVTWTKGGKQYQYVLDRTEIIVARKLIAKSIKLPDLSSINCYRPQSGLSVVQLRI